MKTVNLTRFGAGDDGTKGNLSTDGFACLTLELPWRDNTKGRSCIPCGEYVVTWGVSQRFGECYHVQSVPDRSSILIHAGNWAGDTGMGFKSDVEGCILLGRVLAKVDGQTMLQTSRVTVKAFADHMNRENFTLVISEGVKPKAA